MIIEFRRRGGEEYCTRVDGTGSQWCIVEGSHWYVKARDHGLYQNRLWIDDRNRMDVDGPVFEASIWTGNAVPVHPLRLLAEQAED